MSPGPQDVFVSRKHFPEPPANADPEMRKYLKDVVEAFRSNDKQIENWANTQPQSARCSGNDVTLVSGSGLNLLTLDTSFYDPSRMVDLANDRIIIPFTGIYLFTGWVHWGLGLMPPGNTNIEIFPYKNGVPVNILEREERMVDPAVIATPTQSFAFQSQANIRDYLQIYAQDTGGGVNSTAQVVEMTVTILGRTPSQAQ